MVTTLTLHMRCLSTVAPMARLNASGSEPRDDQEEKVAAATSPLTPRPSTWWLGLQAAGTTMRTVRRGSHAQGISVGSAAGSSCRFLYTILQSGNRCEKLLASKILRFDDT